MRINGVELRDLDMFDADTSEKYEKELEKLSSEMKKITGENMKNSQVIRKECSLIFDFFNNLWGNGTDKKVFGGKTNVLVCMNAVDQVVTQLNAQKGKMDSLLNKYKPNRTQRRGYKGR